MKTTELIHLWLMASALGAQGASAPADPAAGRGPADPRFHFPAGAPAVQRALLLAIDDRAFPLRDNLALFITKPAVRAEPVLVPSTSPDAPDNAAVNFYGTVLHEDGRFRMWYYACYWRDSQGGLGTGPVCYVESGDGEHWIRPNLGQVEWHGSRANNIVSLGNMPERFIAGSEVVRDDDDPRPDWRYKMVYYYIGETPKHPGSKPHRLGTAISSDGMHWRTLAADAASGNFAELGSFYKHNGLYLVSTHIAGHGADDRPEGRQAYTWVSTDFVHWLAESAPSFKTPEPLVGSGYGTHTEAGRGIGIYTQDHIGVGAVSFGNVVIGLYGMWHQRQPNWGEGGINADLGLVVSEDGLHFEEVVKGQPFIRGAESPAKIMPGRHYPTILVQGNGILNVGLETFIYHGRWRNVEFQKLGTRKNDGTNAAVNYWAGIGLARIPRDRWGSLALSGRETSGSAWTGPVTLAADCRLTVNGSGLSGLAVDAADERFQALPGFGGGRAGDSAQDAFDAEVGWVGRRLSDLAGKTVRFHLHFSRSAQANPKLFALNLLRRP